MRFQTPLQDKTHKLSIRNVYGQGLFYRDRRGGGAIALPPFCLFAFLLGFIIQGSSWRGKHSRKLLDFALKGGRLEPVVFDKFLRTMQFLWKSEMFAWLSERLQPGVRARMRGCKAWMERSDSSLVCILESGFISSPIIYLKIFRVLRWLLSVDNARQI